MTDLVKLKKLIEEKGISRRFLYEKMGISKQSLYNKLEGIRPFNQYDIKKICEILDIKSAKEMKDIFFS